MLISEAEITGNRKELIEQYTHTDLLVIEDFGMRRLPATAAEDLLEIFVRRYEKGSIIITSNRPRKVGVNYSEITLQPALSLTASYTMLTSLSSTIKATRMYDRRGQHRQNDTDNLNEKGV